MSDLSVTSDTQPTDEFATIPNVPIQPESDRVSPNQLQSGVSRGTTQKIVNTDGSYMTIGVIPDGSGQLGMAFFTAGDKIISKATSSTQYFYDVSTGKNIMQIGLLPDNTYGWAVARVGNDVKDGFSTS